MTTAQRHRDDLVRTPGVSDSDATSQVTWLLISRRVSAATHQGNPQHCSKLGRLKGIILDTRTGSRTTILIKNYCAHSVSIFSYINRKCKWDAGSFFALGHNNVLAHIEMRTR